MGMCQQRGERKQSAITSRELGFTLIELVIVVGIIGILAAVAVPAYQDYVRRGRIADAVAGLQPMQAKLEQYFLDNRTYVGACGAAGTLAAMPAATANFTYTCPALTANAYTVTATGQGTMAGFAYSLSLAGGVVTKTTDGMPAGWAGAGAACWVFKRDGSC